MFLIKLKFKKSETEGRAADKRNNKAMVVWWGMGIVSMIVIMQYEVNQAVWMLMFPRPFFTLKLEDFWPISYCPLALLISYFSKSMCRKEASTLFRLATFLVNHCSGAFNSSSIHRNQQVTRFISLLLLTLPADFCTSSHCEEQAKGRQGHVSANWQP